jgi:hypothetical protein
MKMRVRRWGRNFGRIELGMACVAAMSIAACGQDPERTSLEEATSSSVAHENTFPVPDFSGEWIATDIPKTPMVPVERPDDQSNDEMQEESGDAEPFRDFVEQITKLEAHAVIAVRDPASEVLVDGDHLSKSKFACRDSAASVAFKFAELTKLSMLRVASSLEHSDPTSIKIAVSHDATLWRDIGVFEFDTIDQDSLTCGDGQTSFGGKPCSLDESSIRYDVFSDFDTTEAQLVRLSIKSEDCESGSMVLNEVEFF